MIYIKKYYKQHLLTTLLAHSLNLNIKENGNIETRTRFTEYIYFGRNL